MIFKVSSNPNSMTLWFFPSWMSPLPLLTRRLGCREIQRFLRGCQRLLCPESQWQQGSQDPVSLDCRSVLDASHSPEYSWKISVNSSAGSTTERCPDTLHPGPGIHTGLLGASQQENELKPQPPNLTAASFGKAACPGPCLRGCESKRL